MDKQTEKIYKMNHKPLFSIITVCYNSEKTIARTIESILAQEFKDYEYIIVDGNSNDNTLNIIHEYEPKFEGRIKIKSEADKGIYDAFNKGIQRSNGTYVWIVNSDDFIAKDALSVLSNYIKDLNKSSLPIISAGMNFIKISGEIKSYYSSKINLKEAYKKNHMGVMHPATLVPKKIYEQYGPYDENFKICADIDWFFRMYKLGVQINLIDNIITNMTEGGVSTQLIYSKSAKDRWRLFRKKYNNIFYQSYFFALWSLQFFKIKFSEHYLKNNLQTK